MESPQVCGQNILCQGAHRRRDNYALGEPFTELVCNLYGTKDAKQAIAHNLASRGDYPVKLFAATTPTFKHIKQTGRLVGIVTAASRSDFEQDLDQLHIPRALLDYTQAADDTPYHKPDPRVFEPALAWLAKHKISPREVLYVGDGLQDMRAATGAGFHFIGVETGLVTSEQFRDEGVMSVANIGGLVQYFE